MSELEPPGGEGAARPVGPSRPLPEGDERRSYDASRLLALSDGVFAIALTLLVLSLRAPDDVTDATLDQALRDLRPELFAYGLTVVVIGAFWIGHHQLFAHIERVDGRLMWLNVLYLGLVALLPFPTDLLGRFGGQRASTMVYAVAVGLTSLADGALELAARRSRLAPAAAGEPSPGGLPLPPVGVVFLASVPVALWSVTAAQWLWLLAAPWGWSSRRLRRRRGRHRSRARRR
jgi:uncharacterized membrane protein